jgi:hypothetical protein
MYDPNSQTTADLVRKAKLLAQAAVRIVALSREATALAAGTPTAPDGTDSGAVVTGTRVTLAELDGVVGLSQTIEGLADANSRAIGKLTTRLAAQA